MRMARFDRRWLLLLPLPLLLGLLALSIYAYNVVPAPLVQQAEERARTYYAEQVIGGTWDGVDTLYVDGHFAFTREAFRLRNRTSTWCLQVVATGRQRGLPVTDRTEWIAWRSNGMWAMGMLNVPWSSLSASACH